MPIRHFESDEASIVIAVAEAGVHADAGGQLSAAPKSVPVGPVNGCIQHGAAEIKPTIVQIAPQVPNVLLERGCRCRRRLLSSDGLGAIRVTRCNNLCPRVRISKKGCAVTAWSALMPPD